MKVKICPTCRKQNSANAWNCDNCGQTLSVQTLIDLDDILVNLDYVPKDEVSPSSESPTEEESSNKQVRKQEADQTWFHRHRFFMGFIIVFGIGFGCQYLSVFSNPYFYTWQKIVRSIVDGVGLVVSYSVAYFVTKIINSRLKRNN